MIVVCASQQSLFVLYLLVLRLPLRLCLSMSHLARRQWWRWLCDSRYVCTIYYCFLLLLRPAAVAMLIVMVMYVRACYFLSLCSNWVRHSRDFFSSSTCYSYMTITTHECTQWRRLANLSSFTNNIIHTHTHLFIWIDLNEIEEQKSKANGWEKKNSLLLFFLLRLSFYWSYLICFNGQ